MPVTITVQSDPNIGPGSLFTLTTDFIGPIPLDYKWELVIVESEFDRIAWSAIRSANGAFTVGGNVTDLDGQWAQMNADLMFPEETAPVAVRGRLLNASFVEIDTGTRTDLKWTTQGNFVREQLAEARFTGSLTTDQAAKLDVVALSVVPTWITSIGGFLAGTLAQLAPHPPLGFLTELDDPLLLVGRGSLTRPAFGQNVLAHGLTLDFFTIPPGFGFRDGFILEYHQRIIQLGTIHTLPGGGREVCSELVDINADHQVWLWENPLPTRVLFDVAPGCAVTARWLVATAP